ncbi:MAG: hypothetical protein JSV86_09720 [Gemmatimonadota bacterium]|nr:MAG: hypothetical protein JSV86_09720 [Gemmatimonadota bacterium]
MSTDAPAITGAIQGGRPLRRYRRLITLVSLLFLGPGNLNGQDDAKAEAWEALRYFLGTWEGKESGVAGLGEGERPYVFIMDGTYLVAANTSTFEPQEANPEGEVHEDWAFFRYDKLRMAVVLREFHGEGFVNQYVLEEAGLPGVLVFVSEAIEKLPAGWRARVTLTIQDDDHFEETFELAAPAEDFELLLNNQWTRRVADEQAGEI